MVRRLALGLAAALLTLSAAGVLMAGPLTASPAAKVLSGFVTGLSKAVLELFR